MAVNYISNIQKLKGRENYDEWAFAAENFLVLDDLKGCLQGTETDVGKDAKAKAKLILTIDASLYVHIKDAKTSKELWDKLKSLFDDSGFARRISLLRTLISTRLDNCDSMSSYVSQLVDTAQKLRGTGFKIDEEWVGSLLLAGLPEKFSPMIMAIEHSGIPITTDSIKSKLLDMEDEVGKAGSAFGVKTGWQSNRTTEYRTKRYGGSTGGTSTVPVRSDIRCYRCKQPGHFKNKCPNAASSENKRGPSKQTSFSNAFSAAFLNGKFSNNDWYVDSGASVHLTAHESWLKNMTVQPDLQEIMVANKTKVPVKCKGDVDVITLVGSKKFDVTIRNVLCVPQLTTNLLSVSQLIKNGNSVQFSTNGCRIYNRQSELIAVADLVDNVYKLNSETTDHCLLAAPAMATANTWHRRLGHINFKDLIKMKNGAVDGLACKDEKMSDNKKCVVCCEGKQSRLPFSHKGSRATRLLEVIHADVCGPMEIQSIGGSKYFLVFEDDYSRMAFVYFLKTKDEVFRCFKEFKSMVENQKDCKIKIFRSDNGGEFCNKEFENFIRQSGIIHQRTNPHTPEQNGLSERLNRTIVEKARCLLFDADLERKFWAEAVNTAVYLRNRSVASGLSDRTPFELWMGRKPDLNNLRVFGSSVMVHIPKIKRSKWDKKSEKLILVGYSDNTKGYRVYNPKNNTVTTSRDVVVLENEPQSNQVTIYTSEAVTDKEIQDSVGAEEDSGDSHEKSDDHKDDDYEEPQHILEVSDCNFEDAEEKLEVSVEEMPEDLLKSVRRSERKPKPKQLQDYVSYMCVSEQKGDVDMEQDPVTVSEALSRPDKEKWRQAMTEEILSFEENEAWELADAPDSGTVVECKWVFKRKCDSENKVRYRARLVAKGFTQRQGIDFEETFSPVVRHSTLRLLIALSVQLNLDITHLDVTTAFLNGILEENVYMRQPEGFATSEDRSKVLKLKKAIYGLKQSSRAWNKQVDCVLTSLNYKRSQLESCVYIKRQNKLMTIVAVYVDDFFIFSNDTVETKILKEKLSSRFKIKDLGEVKQCLGMRISIDKSKGIITLDQQQYVNQLLKRFNMSECNEVRTPMESNVNLKKGDFCETKFPYQQLIGSLMYLAVLTRPDIAYSVSYLSQFNNCYNETHWNCAKRVLRYLQGTKNYCLSFKRVNTELEGFVDADWASDTHDRKSYTGFCFKLSGAAISWESKKQKTVALSSTEAEYMAMSEASKEAIYLLNFYNEIIGNLNCIKLFNDSQSAQKLSVNPVFHKRSKHIDVRHHFIREAIANNLIRVEYLQTADMPADIFTKSLVYVKHSKFVGSLGIENV